MLVNWLGYLVSKHELHVTNLDKDLRDGVVLATIVGMYYVIKIEWTHGGKK